MKPPHHISLLLFSTSLISKQEQALRLHFPLLEPLVIKFRLSLVKVKGNKSIGLSADPCLADA